jgi:hypothetical protein
MTNLDVMNKPEEFVVAYEKAKASKSERKPFNTANYTLPQQLKRFEKASFTEEEDRALDKDLLFI